MKKTILLSTVLFSTMLLSQTKETTPTPSTSNKENQPLFGLRTSLAFNSYSPTYFNRNIAYSSKSSLLNLALTSEFQISKYVALSPELIYLQKGASVVLSTSGGTVGDLAASYAGINVLSKIRYPFEKFELYGIVGPSVLYNLSASTTYSYSMSAGTNDISEYANQVIVDLIVGGGVALKTSTGKLFADLRYLSGLSNFGNVKLDQQYNMGSGVSNGTLNQFSFNVGYLHKF